MIAAEWQAHLQEVAARVTRTIPLLPHARSGLADSTAGISAQRYDGVRSGPRPQDDGLDDDDAGGPEILARPDKARRDKAEIAHILDRMARDAYRLESKVTEYARSGFDRDDPRRAPTKEERNRADEEAQPLNDVLFCASCLRIGHEAPRYRGRLCRWEYELALTYRAMWPQIDEKLTPVDLLRDHVEADQGRVRLSADRVERSLRISFGTPKKVDRDVA